MECYFIDQLRMGNEERILCEYKWRIISRITYDYIQDM